MHLDRHFPVSLLLIHINQHGGNRNGRTGRGDQLQPLEFPGPRRCRATTQSATAASALGPTKSTSLIPHLSNLLYSFQTSPKTGLMKNSRSDFQLVRDLQKFRSTHHNSPMDAMKTSWSCIDRPCKQNLLQMATARTSITRTSASIGCCCLRAFENRKY